MIITYTYIFTFCTMDIINTYRFNLSNNQDLEFNIVKLIIGITYIISYLEVILIYFNLK
jgi:hypothetical protein